MEPDSRRSRDKVLSGESRNITDRPEHNDVDSIGLSDDSRSQSWENTSETSSKLDVSEIAIHSLLVEWKHRGLEREMHQDPGRDRYTSDEEGTVVNNAAEEIELIAVSKRPTRLLPHGTVVRTNLEPSVQEISPLKKIWCVKLMDDDHAPEIMSGSVRLSDLLRAQQNDKMTSNLKKGGSRTGNLTKEIWRKTAIRF